MNLGKKCIDQIESEAMKMATPIDQAYVRVASLSTAGPRIRAEIMAEATRSANTACEEIRKARSEAVKSLAKLEREAAKNPAPETPLLDSTIETPALPELSRTSRRK